MTYGIQYSIVGPSGGEQWLTVFIPGADKPETAHSSHPNFDTLVAGLEDGSLSGEDVAELCAPVVAIKRRLEGLSEKVTTDGAELFFDGDPVDDSIAKQVLRFLSEDVADWLPLVNFMERVAANPSIESREQLFNFLASNGYTITHDGFIVAYKGVAATAEEGVYQSINSGPAGSVLVNNEPSDERPKQRVGDVVTMPRSAVANDPTASCSVGLHVAAWAYASDWARGTTFRVLVDPADVVSVPNDSNAQKIRVCRYEIDSIAEGDDAPDTALFEATKLAPGMAGFEPVDEDSFGGPTFSCDDCEYDGDRLIDTDDEVW